MIRIKSQARAQWHPAVICEHRESTRDSSPGKLRQATRVLASSTINARCAAVSRLSPRNWPGLARFAVRMRMCRRARTTAAIPASGIGPAERATLDVSHGVPASHAPRACRPVRESRAGPRTSPGAQHPARLQWPWQRAEAATSGLRIGAPAHDHGTVLRSEATHAYPRASPWPAVTVTRTGAGDPSRRRTGYRRRWPSAARAARSAAAP